jgi:ribulose-5-phosphate 4-epimerase/fuculose-1-phosphate aldolase
MEGHVMHIARIQAAGSLRRGTPGVLVLALVAAAVLAGTSPATAAQRGAASRPAGRLVVAGTISTVAGGLGGPAKGRKVALGGPCGVGYGAGSVYVGSGTVVRKLNPVSGQVATVAGIGLDRGEDSGIPAVDSGLSEVCKTVVDPHGNLVMVDTDGGVIAVVAATTGTFYQQHMTAGDIYAIGNSIGINGYSSVSVDSHGNLAVTDVGNNTIVVFAEANGTFYGQQMTAGGIYTVAGDGRRGYSGDGGPALAAKLHDPNGVTADGAGNLVFADLGNNRVRVVANKTGTFYGRKMTEGFIYTVAGNGTAGYSGDGGPATKAELAPEDVSVDSAGNLVVTAGQKIRVVAVRTGTFYGQKMTAADIYTVAGNGQVGFSGDGGPATAAEFSSPEAHVDGSGNLVIADYGNERVRVVAVKTGTFYGMKMTAQDIYTVAGNGTQDSSGDGGPALKAEFDSVSVAVDGAGNTLISDNFDNHVLVVAGTTGTLYGKRMSAGDIYGVAGNGTAGFSGDGGPATKAELRSPADTVADGVGNLVIADSQNSRVRVVAATTGTFYGMTMTAGDIYTVAGNGQFGYSGDGGPASKAKLYLPRGVAVDGSGNLVIADTSNARIRVVAATTGTFYGQAMTAGNIYTVAGDGSGVYSGDGGPATAAGIDPYGVAADGAGNLVIADGENNRVRVVAVKSGKFYGKKMTAGDIYTVAGGGCCGLGDGGRATAAELEAPDGVAVDGAGNLVIADTNNQRIRVVAAATGTFYGRAMTAGDIYTVAGTGLPGFSGDGGPGAAAQVYYPEGVTADGAGNLLIADGSGRIREVTG